MKEAYQTPKTPSSSQGQPSNPIPDCAVWGVV